MDNEELRDLPTLYLGQPDVHPSIREIPGERIQKWYVHVIPVDADVAYYRPSRSSYCERGQAIATVTVVLPDVMFGDQQDNLDDIAQAIERHATKHIGQP